MSEKSKKEIKIFMEGGVIHDILDIPEDVEIVINDFDIEGMEPKKLITLESGDKVYQSVWGQ